MKMRVPSYPLIAVDPYFSVWSHDALNDKYPVHWSGSRNAIVGTVTIDDHAYCFLGKSKDKVIPQVGMDMDAFSTTLIFENDSIRLTASFLSPMLIDELYYCSRPISYLHLSYEALDGKRHRVMAKITVSEELVLNKAGEGRAIAKEANVKCGTVIGMGNGDQKILHRGGDNIRIDWGYFYLAVKGQATVGAEVFDSLYAVFAETELNREALFVFAYDDILSMIYFDKPLKAYWKKDGKHILEAIDEAFSDYDVLVLRCKAFNDQLTAEAIEKGGEKYAELLQLAYRQVMAGHKLVVDELGNNLYVSKECFSGGFGATVDVTYPSSAMFLKYNPELLKGMLRPIFALYESDRWHFDFAPHDMGWYPLLNGQTYDNNSLEKQMPVEECGNMIILVCAICETENSVEFARPYLHILDTWSHYLVTYGLDPENQLCTDDFAGHMAHNVNLSVKAIMGLAGYAKILERLGDTDGAREYIAKAKEYADSVCMRAKNSDGSYRLAYDRPDTFSLKYNAIWDKLWGTELFGEEFYQNEITRYKKETLPYGVPLDSRAMYTKSDWLHWVSCFAKSREDQEKFTELLWKTYHFTHRRVPMTDWYYADTSEQSVFQHRTVQGGLFMRLLLP